MDNLKNKTRRELISIINDLIDSGNKPKKRFPTRREISDWSMSLWEDKDAITSGYWDNEFHKQRINGVLWVVEFLGGDIKKLYNARNNTGNTEDDRMV